MRRSIVLAFALVIALPTATRADTPDNDGFRAVTVNTPGQTGHVNVVDFARRTAGEDVPFAAHMLDQLPLYSALKYKPGNFAPTRTPAATLPGARIYRDAFGVPAIYGDTLEAAWFGVGYALSQDRMWQQHLLRMVAKGRLSELVGDDGFEMDVQTRRDFYTQAEYAAFYADLEPWQQRTLESYAAGVNLYIAEMHADPTKMPAEIAALGLPIEPWSPLDSLALGTLMARSVASDGGQELENAKLLNDLVAAHGNVEGRKIFNDLVWLNDPSAPTSVPAEEGTFSSYPHGAPLANSLARSLSVTRDLPATFERVAAQLAAERATRERFQETLGLPNPGSNVWAVSPSRSANGNAFLFNGPQVGYTVAGLLTEFEIHGGDGALRHDARGITVAGVPVVGIGYTNRHAWGLTSGLSDTKDLYVEQLVGGTRAYRFNGETREMECRDETFLVKATTAIIEGVPPRVETRSLCRTIHGPVIVIDGANGVAYSQRYAMWGRELGTLDGLSRFPLADSLAEFRDAMSRVTWNENTTYADADGNIAYWHPGLYPARPRAFDERLPYPGTGEAEWEGLLTFEQMPHTENPAQGWVATWNSKPSVGWTSGDPHYSDRPWAQANRLGALTSVLDSAAAIGPIPAAGGDGLVDGTQGIFAPDAVGGLHDLTVDYFRPFLAAAADDPTATQQQKDAIALILDWNGNHQDGNGNGTVDHAGLTLFHSWVEPAARSVFGGYLTVGGFTRGGHRFEPSPVINMFLRALQGTEAPLPQSRDYLTGRTPNEVILATLQTTIGQLQTQFGAAPMSAWLRNAERAELEVQGVGPGGSIPFQDRGSYIQVIEYSVS